MHRSDLVQLIDATLAAQQPDYAIDILRRYLTDWPGDLGAQWLLARAFALKGQLKATLKVLEGVTARDPEDFRAQRFYGEVLRRTQSPLAAEAFAAAHIGDGLGAPAGLTLPYWAKVTRTAHLADRVGDAASAQRDSAPLLAIETPSASPLPSLVHLCALWHAGQLDLAHPLAEGFSQRWPNVIAFKLCLAECLFVTGQHARALELLHNAAAQDLAGQVVRRHWGEAHPYRALWDHALTVTLPGPLPAELIRALGLNRLHGTVAAPSKEAAMATPTPRAADQPRSEELAEIQSQLDALAARLTAKSAPPNIEHYVLLSSRVRLTQLYGADGFALVDNGIRALAEAQTQMRAHVVYADDPESLQPYKIEPVNATNAWDIKLLVGKLVEDFKARGEAIGALLIVGGADIIPFHHLPNPTEDPDTDIPSDNPYAAADDNYFVPEWPVGRIPSDAGRDPALLVRALKSAARHHLAQARKTMQARRSWLLRLWAALQRLLGTSRSENGKAAPSFGYSANVWKSASALVYDTIGDPRDLVTCPPLDTTQLPSAGLAPAHLSYFNLHGIEDGPEWYGQRSPEDPASVPEYPVALRPQDVANSGRAPVIVFSEACYGANIANKRTENALCLRFLDSGTRALVGSTKIAYGSVSAPLIAADLLGQCFWQNVKAGLPAGEALRLAKLQMAQEMSQRQGFLDGEDQKTLISFVLYGDPLASAPNPSTSAAKEAKRRALKFTTPSTRIPTVESVAIETALTPETVAQIKTLVAQYLPAMKDADLRAARTRSVPANAKHAGSRATVITLAKTIQANAHAHPHFARVTFNDQGTVIKLAVSR